MVKPRKTRIKDLRRTELLAAAHRVFMAQGLGGLTTARICDEAGMSPGILSYYFGGKDEVLFGVVRLNNRMLMEDVVLRLATARTRWDRLEAIIEGNFPPGAFERNVANAWLSVCAASNGSVNFARLQRIFYRRLRSNLASVFGGCVAADQFEPLVMVIGTMIDGLWLRKSAGEVLGRDHAVDLLRGVILALLSAQDVAALRQG